MIDNITSELQGFGLEANKNNLIAAKEQANTLQIPKDYLPLLACLKDKEAFKSELKKLGLSKFSEIYIIHAEGATVWDHVKSCFKVIEKLNASSSQKKTMKIVMLYHDYGKVKAINLDRNKEATKKSLNQGRIKISMIGHVELGEAEFKAGLLANGIKLEETKEWTEASNQHMFPHSVSNDPVRIAKLINTWGKNTASIVKKLSLILKIDSKATYIYKISKLGQISKINPNYREYLKILDVGLLYHSMIKKAFCLNNDIPLKEINTESSEFAKYIMSGFKQDLQISESLGYKIRLSSLKSFTADYEQYIKHLKQKKQSDKNLAKIIGSDKKGNPSFSHFFNENGFPKKSSKRLIRIAREIALKDVKLTKRKLIMLLRKEF